MPRMIDPCQEARNNHAAPSSKAGGPGVGLSTYSESAPNPVDEIFLKMGTLARFERNTEIYGEEDAAENFYQLQSGAVRAFKLLKNGRRQIGAFHLQGEVFGLEAGPLHCFGAEAIRPTIVRVVKRRALMEMAQRDSVLAAELWTRTADALRRAHEHMLLLGRQTAEERLVSFLFDMAARGIGGGLVELPMIRRDIADYLGLSLETVSRTFTELESKATIELSTRRRVTLRDPNNGAGSATDDIRLTVSTVS